VVCQTPFPSVPTRRSTNSAADRSAPWMATTRQVAARIPRIAAPTLNLAAGRYWHNPCTPPKVAGCGLQATHNRRTDMNMRSICAIFALLVASTFSGVSQIIVSEPGGSADDTVMALEKSHEYAWRLFFYLKPTGTARGRGSTGLNKERSYRLRPRSRCCLGILGSSIRWSTGSTGTEEL
jgi:hypothetical protein